MLRILIIEDELIISQDVTTMLTKMGYDVIGDAMDFDEAIEMLEAQTPDLILLDINLNGKRDGIDLAGEINRRFQIPFIFTTSYSDAETLSRARKTNPLNYLVKPFKQEQLFTAIEMGIHKLAEVEKPVATDEDIPLIIKGMLFVKDKFTYTKLVVEDILYIKSDGNYLEIFTTGKTNPMLIRASMTNFIARLGDLNFFRCHKSYIVNLKHLTKIDSQWVTVGEEKLPISKNYTDDLFKRLQIL